MDLPNMHRAYTHAYITKQTFTRKKTHTHTQYMNMSKYEKYKNKSNGEDTHMFTDGSFIFPLWGWAGR